MVAGTHIVADEINAAFDNCQAVVAACDTHIGIETDLNKTEMGIRSE